MHAEEVQFSPYDHATHIVTHLLKQYVPAYSEVCQQLGSDALIMLYTSARDTLALSTEELFARASMLDEQSTIGNSVVAAERRYFGSILQSYWRNRGAYALDKTKNAEEAEVQALHGLRQAYAERYYRLQYFATYPHYYTHMQRSNAFSHSLQLLSSVAYMGSQMLEGQPPTQLEIAA